MKKVTDIISKINVLIDELTSYVATVRTNNEPLCQEVDNASNAYFADVTVRENRIKDQIADLQKRKQAILDTLEDMRPHFVNATAEGDAEKIKKLQEQMADLKAEETAIDTQIEFLYNTPIIGSQELFDIAKNLNEKLNDSNQHLEKVCGTTAEMAAQQMDKWEKIHSATKTGWYGPMGVIKINCGQTSKIFEKVKEYHRSGKCIEKPVENADISKPKV